VTVEEVGLDCEDLVLYRRFSLRISDEILSTQSGAVASLSPFKNYSLFYYHFATKKRKYFPQYPILQHSQPMYLFF